MNPKLATILRAAARLQELIPDAVLVGGTAAAYHASHRLSLDDDHVLVDLRDRFDDVLNEDWTPPATSDCRPDPLPQF